MLTLGLGCLQAQTAGDPALKRSEGSRKVQSGQGHMILLLAEVFRGLGTL
jgi:hypothetical protein